MPNILFPTVADIVQNDSTLNTKRIAPSERTTFCNGSNHYENYLNLYYTSALDEPWNRNTMNYYLRFDNSGNYPVVGIGLTCNFKRQQRDDGLRNLSPGKRAAFRNWFQFHLKVPRGFQLETFNTRNNLFWDKTWSYDVGLKSTQLANDLITIIIATKTDIDAQLP